MSLIPLDSLFMRFKRLVRDTSKDLNKPIDLTTTGEDTKLDKKIIETINNYLLKKIKVNFTFLNIVNKKNLKMRLLKRKKLNRYDKFNYTFYNKVQNGFLNQASKKKQKYLIVNSNKNIIENKIIIINKINKLLKIK